MISNCILISLRRLGTRSLPIESQIVKLRLNSVHLTLLFVKGQTELKVRVWFLSCVISANLSVNTCRLQIVPALFNTVIERIVFGVRFYRIVVSILRYISHLPLSRFGCQTSRKTLFLCLLLRVKIAYLNSLGDFWTSYTMQRVVGVWSQIRINSVQFWF